MRFLITGASGFIGQAIVKKILDRGDEVHILARNVSAAAVNLGNRAKYFKWDATEQEPPVEAYEGVQAVINLSGENISIKKWTEAQKEKILSSRVLGTRNLIAGLATYQKKFGAKDIAFVSASAVGIYGDQGDRELTEKSPTQDSDYLSHVCKAWEEETDLAGKLPKTRVVKIRIGVVIGKNGGVLKKVLPLFNYALGGVLGSGKQMMSWIHLDDLVDIFMMAADRPEISGVINGTSPRPVNNKVFTYTLGKVVKRPIIFPVPQGMLKLFLGEMSQIVLTGQKVLPERALQLGFKFRYQTIEEALRNLLGKK